VVSGGRVNDGTPIKSGAAASRCPTLSSFLQATNQARAILRYLSCPNRDQPIVCRVPFRRTVDCGFAAGPYYHRGSRVCAMLPAEESPAEERTIYGRRYVMRHQRLWLCLAAGSCVLALTIG